MSENQDLDGMSSKQGSVRPSIKDDESSMLGTEDMPVDVKKLKGSLNEQAEMLKIVKEFEEVYFAGKGNYNKLDAITMNSDITMKSLRHCFKLNQKHLLKEDPDFDILGMSPKLEVLYKNVQETNTRYNGVKGAEMLLSEQIINKDTSAFKLVRIAKARREQMRFYEKMDDIDDNIYAQEKEVTEIWQTYEDFNEELFRKKLGEGQAKKKECAELFTNIEAQMVRMQKDYDQIVIDMDIVKPYTEEHKLRITKIQMEIAKAGDVLKAAYSFVEKERKAEKRFEEASKECHALIDLIDKLNDENDLVKLVEIVDRLGELVENLHEWQDLWKRLKALNEDQIQPAKFVLEHNRKSLDKWIADVRKVLIETFEECMKKIEIQGKSNNGLVQHQQSRLFEFEERNLNDPINSMNIAKADLLFLKKEVTRYDVSVGMVLSICDTMMERCRDIAQERVSNAKLSPPIVDIDPETLHTLVRNQKHLETQDTVEIPRIKKNIDQLEAYNIKALKNKLNDDNKTSQAQISAMKKRFEDLQKYIDSLNGKVGLVRKNIAALHTQFNDEDIEKDNDFKNILEAKVDDCDKDINGDKENRASAVESASEQDDGGYAESKMNLIARKKQIIAAINKMVNQFNENNKLIKDSNKSPKTDTEINAIISKSLDLQNFCSEIDKKVGKGKDFAKEIEVRLDMIIDPKIPQSVEKFTEKNNCIDDCDELFDANEAKVNKIEAILKTKIAEVDAQMARIMEVSPLENPGIQGKQNENFVKVISSNIDKTQSLLQEYRDCQANLVKLQDKLMDDIQPLNELGEREVKTFEIEQIMEKMRVLGNDFDELERLINPLDPKLRQLEKEIDAMIMDEKKNQGGAADKGIKHLNDQIANLEILRSDAGIKLEEYNKLIMEAKEKFGEEDKYLFDTLNHLEEEARVIQETIKSLEGDIAELMGKRDELKQINDDAFEKPNEFTPKQIQDLVEKIEEQRVKAADQQTRETNVNTDLNQRIEDIKKLCAVNQASNNLRAKAKEIGKEMKDDMKALKELLNTLPIKIDEMLESLEEQKKDTLPDINSADYFEIKRDIDNRIKALKDQKSKIMSIKQGFPKHETNFDSLLTQSSKKENDFDTMKDLVDQLTKEKVVVKAIFVDTKGIDASVSAIKAEMADSLIPINIAKRAKEISQLTIKIDDLNTKFRDFKNNELNDTGSNEFQQEIRDIIGDMMERLDEADMDKRELKKFQKSTLEQYGQKDFVDSKNAPIIIEVRIHKENIQAAFGRLQELEDYFQENVSRKDQYHAIDTVKTKCDKELDAMNEILDKYPEQIQKMLETLEEMLKDSTPNKTADYFEKKAEIEVWVKSLNDSKAKLDKLDQDFPKIEDDIDALVAKIRENNEVQHLQTVNKGFQDLQIPIAENMKNAKAVVDKVIKIKEQMGECEISVNIHKRANDIITFDDGLKIIKEQFEILRFVDEDIDEELLNPESEAEIRKLVLDIDAKIYDFDVEKEGFQNLQAEVLEKYTQKDFVSLDNAPIIVEVREHKKSIDDAIARLRELAALVKDALARKDAYKVINELGDSLQADLCALKDMFSSLPEEVEGMLVTLSEMYNGSVGDEIEADYHGIRQDIEEWIFNLKVAKTNMQTVSAKYYKKEKECLLLIEDSKEPTDTEGLEKFTEKFGKMKTDIDAILAEAEGCNDQIMEIRNQMGECLIPDNITKRANEIDMFKEKINRITYDFFDFKIEYAKNSRLSTEMKKGLKVLIDEIDKRIFGFEEEKKVFIEFQKQRLELYSQKDFVSLENPPIIIEIREFKARIGDAKERLKDLEEFIDDCVAKKESYQIINTLNKDIDLDLHNLREFFNSLPGEIKNMLASLDQMLKGSVPNESADYFEQKTKIVEQTKSVNETLGKIGGIEKDFNEKLIQVGLLVGESKKQSTVTKLQKMSRDYEREKVAVQEILQRASACRDTIDYVKSEMDECEIPRTIVLRSQEIEQFNTKFDSIQADFQEIKSSNIEENSSDSKAAIRAFIDEINKRLYGLDDERIGFVEYQKSTLEQYSPKDFSDLKNAPIIQAVREHKHKIQDAYERLEDLEAFVNSSKAKKTSLIKIDKLVKDCKNGTDQLAAIIMDTPKNIQKLSAVLREMLLAAEPMKGYPNETADYWTEKGKIIGQQGQINQLSQQIDNVDDEFASQEEAVKELVKQSKGCEEIEVLINIASSLEKQKNLINKTLKQANDIKTAVAVLVTELDDQRIPKTIRSRQDEILSYQDKLVTVKSDFGVLKKSATEEADQKKIIELSQKVAEFDSKSTELVNYQLNKLQSLCRDDFFDHDKSVLIIPLIKKHKDNIADAVERLRLLGELIKRTHEQLCSQGDIAGLAAQLKGDIASLKVVLSELPPKIESMLKTLQEMKNGSTPDDSADYWEERQSIADNIKNLLNAQHALGEIEDKLSQKEGDINSQVAKSKKTQDIQTLQKIQETLETYRSEITDILNKAYDQKDVVNDTKEKMAECEIPVNISMRANEIDQYREKLERIVEDFKDLKQADEDFDGTSESESEIKVLIEKIETSISGFENEKQEFLRFHKSKLARLSRPDFISYDNAPIIAEIREFKARIGSAYGRLKGLDDLTNDLNSKLIVQDIENATKLLEVKNHKLRERLEIAQKELGKINKCGDEMDGNCSRNEEEEFIEALKDEMPEVFKNIDGNFEQITKVDQIIIEIQQTKSIEMMQTLKLEVDDASIKVEQCEGLVNKLENEIIEWDALRKLCRRDEELEEIDHLLRDFQSDLENESNQMYPKLEQNSKKLELSTSPADIQDFTKLVEGIKEYVGDVEKLTLEVNSLLTEKEECFEEFDTDVPGVVKRERDIRRKQKSLVMTPSRRGKREDMKSNGSNLGDDDKPTDMYYMIEVNCQYRKRIHEMLKNLRELNKKRRELEDKWGPFKRELNKVKEVKVYKPVKGDAIDELFAFHLNKHQLNLPIKRLGPGKYLFGTKQILAKIINGKLVIRVGGGYMSADEFIEQYGPMEILKIQQAEERAGGTAEVVGGVRASMSIRASMRSPKSGGSGSDMAQMKAQMREQMNNIKIYGDDQTMNTGKGSPGRMSIAQAERRASGMAGSPRPDKAALASPKASRRSPKNA